MFVCLLAYLFVCVVCLFFVCLCWLVFVCLRAVSGVGVGVGVVCAPAAVAVAVNTRPAFRVSYRVKGSFKGHYKGSIGFKVLGFRGLPGIQKTYRFKGSTFYLRGHNLLFCRVWGHSHS